MSRNRKRNTIRYTHPLLAPTNYPHLFTLLERNAMAKKKVAQPPKKKGVKKRVARKKDTPAPGQQSLPSVEDDRDPELDNAAVAVATTKRQRQSSKDSYDDALSAMGELMQQKGVTSYTSAGLNFTVAHEDKVKVSKAKD